jgi:outer membrane protein OmpA-like peptidoglycan-associated protein
MRTLAGRAVGLMLPSRPLQVGAAVDLQPSAGRAPPHVTMGYAHHLPPHLGALERLPYRVKVPEVRPGPESRPPELALRETARAVRIELPGDVLFDRDRWELRPDAELTLRQVAELTEPQPRAKVTIAGRMGARGANAYNLHLSESRAVAVKAWLADQGVDGEQATIWGWGEATPVAPNTYPSGGRNITPYDYASPRGFPALPRATRNITLLSAAWGEKKRVTSSSKNVRPLAPSRCA